MAVEERQLRADAERNRRRLLVAAQELFRERGLDVSVAEIAQAAEVGRGTLFRNFASKEDLIAAIVADKMHQAAVRGRELLEADEPGEALFEFVGELVGRQQVDRALFEALEESWLARDEIRNAHAQIVAVLDGLLQRAQECGAIRRDVGAMDVLMMFKGACVAATAFGHGDPAVIDRHLDLIRASLVSAAQATPLRGRTPTLEQLEGGGIEGTGEHPAGREHRRGRDDTRADA
jgi:AcrR family transcriptional regulator